MNEQEHKEFKITCVVFWMLSGLYERAVCDNALDSSLWLEFLNYTSNELHIGPVVLDLAERSSRNCPWDGSIWVQWLHEIEKFNGDTDAVRGK